jgi:type I restriction enzyme S subunit
VPKRRFLEFTGDGEWEEKSFDQMFTIGSGKDYKHLQKGPIPVYGSGGYMLSVNEWLYEGDSVCIGRKGTIDKPMFLTGKFWTVDTLFYTHSFRGCLPKFVYLVFQQVEWAKHNEAGGVPSLSKAIIGHLKTRVPSLDEQKKIADCFSFLDDLIAAQHAKFGALKHHKKGLTQGMFSNPKTKVDAV